MATFAERFRNAIDPRGYEIGLRRSIQSVVLFEARRMLAQLEAQRAAENQATLRAFQRKHVHWELAKAVLEMTDLEEQHKNEVMWRTGTSKESIGSETAWKRGKAIEKDVAALADAIRPFHEQGRSEEEAIGLFVQTAYEATSAGAGRDRVAPRGWGYSHNNCLLCYQIYYRDGQVDPSLPPAMPSSVIQVPMERPEKTAASARAGTGGSNMMIASTAATATTTAAIPHDGVIGVASTGAAAAAAGAAATPNLASMKEHDVNVADLEAIVAGSSTAAAGGVGNSTSHNSKISGVEERRAVLQEVREHLDILKEFQDLIPEEELNKRKRELYLALPDAPPPAAAVKKRGVLGGSGGLDE